MDLPHQPSDAAPLSSHTNTLVQASLCKLPDHGVGVEALFEPMTSSANELFESPVLQGHTSDDEAWEQAAVTLRTDSDSLSTHADTLISCPLR